MAGAASRGRCRGQLLSGRSVHAQDRSARRDDRPGTAAGRSKPIESAIGRAAALLDRAFLDGVEGVARIARRSHSARRVSGVGLSRPAASSGTFGNQMIQDPAGPAQARAPSNKGDAPIGQTRRLTRRPGTVIVPELENRLPLWGPATFERRRGTLQRSGAPFSCEVSRRAR